MIGTAVEYLLCIYGSTALVDLGRFFQLLNRYTVGWTPWTGESAHRKAAAHTHNDTNVHASSWIRTHNPIVLAGEES
jgi:hypothetical protein